MTEPKRHSLWYKDAIIYELHVKAFADGNGDGRGDFRGLIDRLDYVQDLGVTALWLLPFYPSPLRDDGYDIADYRGIHPDYGTLRDFRAFVREAHRRNLRVITELVVNHTSDQHPWFQASRRAAPGSARRDFYVWSDTDARYDAARIIFTDTERSNWSWDPLAGAYYWHRFFSHQPDLNFDNPRVVQSVIRALRYWLDMGVDGMRLDAVPYLCEREGTSCENLPETHAVIREIRRVLDAHYQDRMLLAEANQWPADVRPYFGDGDECHMAFHFPLMPRMFMALRQEDRRPITEILGQTPEIPADCQWALFLRNHDELTLEMVTDEERDYMYREYAQDPRMRVNIGIRRRLAPLVDNGRRRIELLNSLLFSFPGTPVIYYGDELGMGDNIFLGDRDGVRTPMQWTADRNAGFSRADPQRLYLPPIMDAVYGYQALNVEAQQRNPSSLLHFMKRMIALRRQHKAFGRGTLEFLRPRNRKVLAYVRRWRGEVILCVANLSRFAQPVELDLSEFRGYTPLEMIGRTEFPTIGHLPYFLTPGPHAFYWFLLEPQAAPMAVGGSVESRLAIPRISIEDGGESLFEAEYRYTLTQDLLLPFLRRQRWFQGKARDVVGVAVSDVAKPGASFYLALVEVRYDDGGAETYAVPLKLAHGEAAARVLAEAPSMVIAQLRSGEGDGVLFDAMADVSSCAALFAAMLDGRRYVTERKAAVESFSGRGLGTRERELTSVRRLSSEQSNTSIVLEEAYVLKLFRRIEEGPNPDLEVGRFLTERTRFENLAPVVGGIEYRKPGALPATLVMLQQFVPNDGDGWAHAQALLADYFRAAIDAPTREPVLPPARLGPVALTRERPPPAIARRIDASVRSAERLGRRVGEFHVALASDLRDADFAPEPLRPADLHALADELARHARQVLELLDAQMRGAPAPADTAAHEVLSAGSGLLRRFHALAALRSSSLRIRIHGDLHLGQVLRTGDDFLLLDFEGEPLRSIAERRRKLSPLRDVAGMLRSFDYAAHAAFERLSGERPEATALREPWLRAWTLWVSSAFLRAYLDAVAPARLLPDDPDELELLLDAFVLNKAFYELQYEMNNRPDWLRIPLDGIRTIASRGEPDPKTPGETR